MTPQRQKLVAQEILKLNGKLEKDTFPDNDAVEHLRDLAAILARSVLQQEITVDSNGLYHGPIGNNPRHPLDMD